VKIHAPWTAEQVGALNRWQKLGYVHEFTCPGDHADDRALVAAADGWHCLTCGYTQDWAHDFMLETPPDPRNSIDIIKNEPGWFGSFTRAQAPGAPLPNGTRVCKVASDKKGDITEIGTRGTILGSLKHPDGRSLFFYFVEWDDKPKVAIGVTDWKIEAQP
jgi:hypothetical protein